MVLHHVLPKDACFHKEGTKFVGKRSHQQQTRIEHMLWDGNDVLLSCNWQPLNTVVMTREIITSFHLCGCSLMMIIMCSTYVLVIVITLFFFVTFLLLQFLLHETPWASINIFKPPLWVPMVSLKDFSFAWIYSFVWPIYQLIRSSFSKFPIYCIVVLLSK